MAEWSKALVLGTSHFDGVGSANPTADTPLVANIVVIYAPMTSKTIALYKAMFLPFHFL